MIFFFIFYYLKRSDDKTSRLKKRSGISQSTDKKFVGLAISPNLPSSQPGRIDVSVANSQSMMNPNHLAPPSSPQMPIQVESHKNNEYLRFVERFHL